jgi:CRISPR-associated protein Csm3
MNDFLSFQNRYFVGGELVMEQPLHIGKGVSLEPVGTDLPIIKTKDDLPFIPGSSVKGVVRSEFERIIRTFETQNLAINSEPLTACDVFSEPCVKEKEKEKLETDSKKSGKVDEADFTQKLWEKTCTACRLFGSPWIASRVYIKDMPLLDSEELFRLSEIRDGVAIDRDTGTARKQAKFDYEVVPAKARFKFEAVLENVELWEVGLFGVILKLWAHGEIAIGGMTSRGLGWGRLENIEIEKVDRADLIEYILNEKKQHVTLEDCIKEFQKKLVKGGEDA